MEWLLLLLFLPRRDDATVAPPVAKPAPKPAEPGGLDKALDDAGKVAGVITGTVGTGGALVTKGKAALASVAPLVASVGGFGVVMGLWAVTAIALHVVARIMEPEINRRRTVPAWLTGEPWGFAWRGAREFWLRAVESRPEGAGLIRLVYRWTDGDGRYGDLNVQGELVYLSRVDEGAPGDRFAFYDAIAWAKARAAPPALQAATDAAHQLARAYGRAFLATTAALADVSGQRAAGQSVPTLAALDPEGAITTAVSSPSSSGYSIADMLQAVAAGVAAGTGVARVSYAEAGTWLFENVNPVDAAAAVVSRLREAGFAYARAHNGDVVLGDYRATMPGGRANS